MRKEAVLWSCVALLILGAVSHAGDQRPYLGMTLDTTPLPELLTKHLQLDPGQGLRITNIMIGGPAEKAGLDRDDIIVVFQGSKIRSFEQFVGALREAGVGTGVSLEVIHLGQRRTVHPKLEPAPDGKEVSWKYPPEDGPAWRPGRIFKIGPDGQGLTEVPFDKIPDLERYFRRFQKESYTYHHAMDGENYSITIEGDPTDEDSQLVVQAGGQRYSATVGSIEALPEKYRTPARQAVEDACSSIEKGTRVRRFSWPEGWGSEARRKFFEDLPRPDLQHLLEQKDRALEKLQEQMERLKQRVNEMEERNREILDRLRPKSETETGRSAEPQTPAPAESPQKPAI